MSALVLPSDQYLRTAVLVVGGLEFVGRISFNLKIQQNGSDPSNCEIKAYNLTSEHRAAMESGNPNLYLSAGYNGANKLLYGGSCLYVESLRQGADIITSFHGQCGLPAVNNTVLTISGSPNDYQIYQACLNALGAYGVVQGHFSASIKALLQGGVYSAGLTDIGYTSKFLDLITHRHGLFWNIHGGAMGSPQPPALNIFSINEYQDSQPVLLSAKTGMIGIPSKTLQNGVYKVRSLLNGDLAPGKCVTVTSVDMPLPNSVRIIDTTHVGDTLEGDFYTEIEAHVLGVPWGPSL